MKKHQDKIKMEEPKKFEDYPEEIREMLKEIVIERIKTLPSNLRISIG